MERPKCEDCIYWVIAVNLSFPVPSGLCHSNSPSVLMAPETESNAFAAETHFPVMRIDEVACGGYKRLAATTSGIIGMPYFETFENAIKRLNPEPAQ